MLDAILVPLWKRFEGLHKVGPNGLIYPYICPAGYWTQGYGQLVKDGDVGPITTAEANLRMIHAIPGYTRQTLALCPVLAQQPAPVIAAVVDFTFNLGAGRLRASTLRKRVNEQDWDGACDELGKWVYGGGKRLPGLILRRAENIKLIRSVHVAKG